MLLVLSLLCLGRWVVYVWVWCVMVVLELVLVVAMVASRSGVLRGVRL